jgi:hypothetical protein
VKVGTLRDALPERITCCPSQSRASPFQFLLIQRVSPQRITTVQLAHRRPLDYALTNLHQDCEIYIHIYEHNMQLKPAQYPPIPCKPQLHSAKCHQTYNGSRVIPKTTWVRSPTVRQTEEGDYQLVLEIVLYFERNRACTIYRTWDDFSRLQRNLTPWKNSPVVQSSNDIRGMHRYLQEALAKRPRECGMEYFLRRKMGDCEGL